ncbi:MAG: hypothetical protein ACOVSW_20285, partial [Candidatus Kapaibacteriota bacterium]
MNLSRTSRGLVIFLTLLSCFAFSPFRAVAATYTYNGAGDAGVSTNWGGAPNFTTSGDIFQILGGQTATVNTDFTLGTGVIMNITNSALMQIAPGRTLTNNGTLNVTSGGILELQGTGQINPLSANAVTYQATDALLLITGTVAKTTNIMEIPNTMPGSVTFSNTFGATLGTSPNIQGTFTATQGVRGNGAVQTLTLSGPITFSGSGQFLNTNNLSFVIQGSGLVSGIFDTGGSLIQNFTMNRAGVTVVSSPQINGTLTLTAGAIRPQTGNYVMVYNTAVGSVVAGAGYVDTQNGALRRNLPFGTLGGDYIFPVGRGSQYLPFTLRSGAVTTTAAYMAVFAYSVGSGGTVNCSPLTSISNTEYWYVEYNVGTATGDFDITAPSVVTGSVIGARVGAPVNGLYTPPAGTPSVSGQTVRNNANYTFGGALSYLTVAGNAPAPTYTMTTSGDPNVLANWSGSPPSFAVPCAQYVIPNGITAVMTGNWTLGSAAGSVQLIVQSGGTLNTGTGAANSVIFAGNNAVVNLQNGATFITRNTNGVNGSSNTNGAIRLNLGTETGFVTNYGTMVNFSFGTVAPAGSCYFSAAGQKLAITQVASLTTNTPIGSLWSLNSALTVANALTVVAGDFYFNKSLVFKGAAGSSTNQGPHGRIRA